MSLSRFVESTCRVATWVPAPSRPGPILTARDGSTHRINKPASHIGALILKMKEKFHKTALVVTHDTHLAKKLADRLIFLHEGRVVFFGPWAEFESTSDRFLRNFRLQDELIPALDVTS